MLLEYLLATFLAKGSRWQAPTAGKGQAGASHLRAAGQAGCGGEELEEAQGCGRTDGWRDGRRDVRTIAEVICGSAGWLQEER